MSSSCTKRCAARKDALPETLRARQRIKTQPSDVRWLALLLSTLHIHPVIRVIVSSSRARAQTVAMLGYDDALMTVDRVMVRIDAQGKYAALSLEDYYAAKKAGRISRGDNGIENLAPEVVAADASDGP